ncbi:NAD(P)-binding domain [Phytophthora cactorum]|nr:NAD(P)-binding domain [Phytophthora cactorum]
MEWMCQQTGYKCEYVDMPDEELTKWWLDRGLPTDMATGDFSQLPMKLCIGDAICCGEMLGNGSMNSVSDTVEKLTGRKPARYQDYLLKYKDIFPRQTSNSSHSTMVKYVLMGAGGNVGGVAADFAVEIAKPEDQLVFASSSLDKIPAEKVAHWRSKGVEVLSASYDDRESMKKAFEGAEAVATISTWLIGDRRRNQIKNALEVAKEKGVKRFCYTSGAGAGVEAETEEDIPYLLRDHHYIEQLIYASGLQYNIQRNCLYADNIPMYFAPSWGFCGDKWLTNSHGQKGCYVSRDDCGRVVGALLLGRGEPNKVYEVTGGEGVSHEEIFEFMSSEVGYDGELVDMPDEELKKWWLDRGLPKDVYGDFSQLPMKLCIGDLLCSGEMVANGCMTPASDAVEKLTGRKPAHWKDAMIRYKDIFPKSK